MKQNYEYTSTDSYSKETELKKLHKGSNNYELKI